MKLQFAFGNPRKKAKKSKAKTFKRKKFTKVKKSKKVVAKTIKRPKTKVKPKAIHKMKHKKSKALKKNPDRFQIRKKGKLVHSGVKPNMKDLGLLQSEFLKAEKEYKSAAFGSKSKIKARSKYAAVAGKLKKMASDSASAAKLLQRFQEEGATITNQEITMAKKKKASKKKSYKKAFKKKATSKPVAIKKAKKKASKKKTHKKKAHKKALVIKKVHKKAHKKAKKHSKKHGKKHKQKLITHKHSAKTGHFKRGSKIKFKKTVGKGKKKFTLSGLFKLNPTRSNPMSKISDLAKSATSLDTMELISLGVGGALVPVINSGIGKIPYMDVVVGKINEFVGPQATGSIVPMLIGALMNVGADHLVKDAKTKKYINSAGDGLISAGIIGLTMSLSQKYVVEGMMAGVLYSPMNGVNYTPMSGVQYTPMSGVPQLAGPDFGRTSDYGGGAGYTEGHRFSSADFGRAMDEESDELTTEDDMSSDNLSGVMG